MSQFHVAQIETRMLELFEAGHRDPNLDDIGNLTRYLALYGLQLALGGIEGHVLFEITDGENDRGIDAVAVDEAAKLVVLVQSSGVRTAPVGYS